MKRGRILSLFLSVVLLASAIIPCLQLSVNADKANAISKITSAWNDLKKVDGTPVPVPAELNTTDLLEAISIAEDAIADSAYTDDSKASLKTAVNNAWAIVKGDEELLAKALQSTWNDLVKNEETVLSMSAYNKTGLNASKLSLDYNQNSSSSNYIKDSAGNPLNDPAHSGLITTKGSTTDEDIANFGNSYAELRREDPDVVGTSPNFDQDIPSFTVGDVILTNYTTVSYREDITSLSINFLSTKKLKIGYKVWYVSVGGVYSATEMQYVDIPANIVTTVDLKATLNNKSLTEGKSVGNIKGMAFYISAIDGEVADTDVLKIGSVVGNLYDTCPSSVSGDDVSLATIYNKASSLDFTQYFDNAAKTRFQTLLNDAKTVIRNSLLKRFEVKDELLNVAVNELWPSLTAKELRDIVSFSVYNSSGNRSDGYSDVVSTGSTDKSNAEAGISDAANSGVIELLNSSESQQANFGNNYVRLTTSRFSSGDSLNEDKTNDIPYLSTESVVVTPTIDYPTSNLKSLTVTVNSSMAMNVGYRIWVGIKDKPEKENATTSIVWAATGINEAKIKEGINTIDLRAALDKYQAELDAKSSGDPKYMTEIATIKIVAFGIKTMAETPDSTDYLEIGNVRGRFSAVLPEELKSGVNAIKMYDAMKKLNLDEYVDGEAKDNFILAMEAAKMFSEQEWEEIYNDQDRLALLIKNQLWPKLANKITFAKPFRYYNSTGKNDVINYVRDQIAAEAPAGTGSNASGLVWGQLSNAEQKEIYGERYYRLTTTKTDPSQEIVNDRDIPYLGEEIVVITLGANDNPKNFIDVPGSNGIYIYLNASMKMSVKMRIWYMKSEDTNGNGEYDDWGADQISFNIEKGLNKINIKQLLVDSQIDTKMKYMHYVTLNAYNYEHTPTGDDFLEVGSIGNEEYATLPRKLENITSLSAIIREAGELNMDDYVDNADKTMFQNAVARGIQLLNNLDINLTEHVPVEVYETDASGKRTKLGEDKFGYDEQAKLYDGDTVNNPVELDVKNKKLDIIFNLNDKMKLYDIRAYLAENNVKDMKIYTAPVREAIWDESGLVYQYDGTDYSTLNIGRSFSTPIENQYVRFSFNQVDGDTLKLTEIKCMGKGIQQLAYTNIIEGKTDIMSYADVNYDTKKSQFIRFDSNKFGDSIFQFKDANVAHDGYLDTIVDFCGGSRSENKTYNIVFDLNGLSAVDNIKYYAGSNPEYFPRKMKFYVGNDQMNILDNSNKGTVCVAEFNGATTDENGLYEAKFLAQNAAYVRIELIEDGVVSDDGRYGDNLLAVARDIQINGLSLNASKSDAVKSFTDAETGIIVDILKFNEGDIYETVQGMKLTKRKPTAAEIQQAGDFGFVFRDWFYTVTLLNYRGDPVTDVEGREIRVSVPLGEDEDMDTAFMATILGDEVVLMEHELRDINDKYYVTVFFDDPVGLVFARGNIDEDFVPELDEEEFEDDYEDEDYYDEEDYDDDYDDEEEEEEEEEEEDDTSNPKRKKYYKVIKKGGGLSTGAIVGIVAGSVVAVSGGSLLIIFRKKIFKPRIKKPKV